MPSRINSPEYDVFQLIEMYKMEESEFDMTSKSEFFAWKYPDIAPLLEEMTWEVSE